MAILLELTDGFTTVALDSTHANVVEYVPLAGPGDVTETAKVWIQNTTLDGVLATVRSIEMLFQQAAHHTETLLGPQVTVRFRPAALGQVYSSPILAGRVDYERDALLDDLPRLRFDLRLTWTRRGYWEGSQVELPLTNGQGTRVMGGLTVFNPCAWRQGTTFAFVASTKKIIDSNAGLAVFKTGDTILVRGSASNDGTYTIAVGGVASELVVAETLVNEPAGAMVTLLGPTNNHVEIALADVVGTMPAPLRLEITNPDTGAAVLTQDLYIGHAAFSDAPNLTALLEGEAAPVGDGTRTDDASCSGAQYMAHTWSGTTETRLSSIPLSTALLNAACGNHFLVLARLQAATAYTDLWLRLKIETSAGGPVLWSGSAILVSTGGVLQELGTVQLPPYLVGAGDLQPAVLSIYAKRYTAGTHSLGIDYLQLMPLDTYRRLVALGDGLDSLQTLTDDGIAGYVYVTAAGGKVQSYVGYGDPIRVWPQRTQRLYFVQSNEGGASKLSRSLKVRAWYRPRVATM